MIFLRVQSIFLLRVIRIFFLDKNFKPNINTTQTRFLKNLAESTLWSGPFKMPISVLLKKDLKVGQSLDMYDMISPSKFGEVK